MVKATRTISLILICVLLFSTLSAPALALDDINFIPELKSGRIYGTALKTPVAAISALYKSRQVKVFNNDGIEVTSFEDVYMGTGFTMKLNDKLFYSAVVMGDINGDGELTQLDYILIKRAYLGTFRVSSLAKAAADVAEGEELRPINYIKVKRAYFGTYDINKKYTCEPYDPNQGNDGWSDGWI